MLIKLLVDVRYPAVWVLNGPKYCKGQILPAVTADNIPGEGAVWIDTPVLKNDPYGMLLLVNEYEII